MNRFHYDICTYAYLTVDDRNLCLPIFVRMKASKTATPPPTN